MVIWFQAWQSWHYSKSISWALECVVSTEANSEPGVMTNTASVVSYIHVREENPGWKSPTLGPGERSMDRCPWHKYYLFYFYYYYQPHNKIYVQFLFLIPSIEHHICFWMSCMKLKWVFYEFPRRVQKPFLNMPHVWLQHYHNWCPVSSVFSHDSGLDPTPPRNLKARHYNQAIMLSASAFLWQMFSHPHKTLSYLLYPHCCYRWLMIFLLGVFFLSFCSLNSLLGFFSNAVLSSYSAGLKYVNSSKIYTIRNKFLNISC